MGRARQGQRSSVDLRPPNYVYPLAKSWEHVGSFIRLSRVWDLAQKDLAEEEYEEMLKPMLDEHSVAEGEQNDLLRPLAQFMKVVENIKVQ